MSTVNKLLLEAIKYDEISMAYMIYISVQEGLIQMTDSVSDFMNIPLPTEKIKKAIETDYLNLKSNMIKLYLVKYHENYAVYLAKNHGEVEQLHNEIFQKPVPAIVDATNKKEVSIYDDTNNKYMSFRQIQQISAVFPMFVGLMPNKARKKAG